MNTHIVPALVLAVVLVSGPLATSAQGDLSLIAPGLRAQDLCPLVKSTPQVAIDAIAAGTNKAYTQGSAAQDAYAAALGAAVGAAAGNGCIDDVFEVVNQAIIKGGFPTEYVVGKALAMGTALGVDSETGEVLAKATAVVMCRGGESASACARAWNQAIKIDSNGCAVLVRAFARAKASCGPGYATSQTSSTVFREPLGVCGADEFRGGSRGGAAGNDGQTGKYKGYTKTLPFHKFAFAKTYGRRMLAPYE